MAPGIEYLKKSKLLWYGVSSLIIAALIYTADLGEFLSAMGSVDLRYLGIALFLGMAVFAVWGYIWYSFFQDLQIEVSIMESYKMFMAGTFMNSITPLGNLGGEPFMALVVSKNTDASYEKAISSVISADMVNAIPVISYLTIGIIYMLSSGMAAGFTRQALYLTVAIIAVFGTVMYFTWFDSNTAEKKILYLLDTIENKVKKSSDIIEVLREKIKVTKETFEKVGENKTHLLKLITISHTAPLLQTLCLYFLIAGTGSTPTLIGAYLTIILASLAMFSPTPGGSGTSEAAMTGLLLIFYPGMEMNLAVALAILMRLTTYWPGVVIGYLSLLNLRK